MRRLGTGVFAFLAILLLAMPAAAQVTTWDIDGAHSAANFSIRHMMVSNVRGTFAKVTGTITIDEADVTKSSVDVTIDASSIDTQNENRDKHLKSPDFFDVEKFPTITFKSKKVEKAGSGLRVTGDLTMHGVTKEVTLDVDGPTPPLNAGRQVKRGASATTKINRKDFGLTWNRAIEAGGVAVGDEVNIVIDLELNKKA